MELKHIKELMTAMGRTSTKRLVIRKEGFELELEREEMVGFHHTTAPIEFSEENPLRLDAAHRHASQALSRGGEIPHESKAKREEVEGTFVTSPMVGTFYSSPSPEDPAFVKVGDRIEKSTVVCIIEAMKVMNEVKAGIGGIVAEVLVESGHPVEFGTKLYRII